MTDPEKVAAIERRYRDEHDNPVEVREAQFNRRDVTNMVLTMALEIQSARDSDESADATGVSASYSNPQI